MFPVELLDGRPVDPTTRPHAYLSCLTKRELFATIALHALITTTLPSSPETCGATAVKAADCLLDALNARQDIPDAPQSGSAA